jgi:hypothetical protein
MRNLFMSPRNWFRMEEAVLSLLAGDIFAAPAVRWRLLVFKAIYYITKMSHLRHRVRDWFGRASRSGSEVPG